MKLYSRLFVLLLFSLVLTGPAVAQGEQPGQNSGSSSNSQKQEPQKRNERPAAAAAKPQAEPFDGASVEKMAEQCVTLQIEAGAIEIEMLAEAAPETVRNFLNLAATGAYDTTTFSRVLKGFVIQGGSLATRQGLTTEIAMRMARKVPDEPSYVKHVRGIVSLARPEEPNSASSHFFILLGDASHLDGKFAAFGRVVRGMDVADTINQAPTEGEKPLNPVRITRASVAPCVKTGPPKG